MTKPSFFFAHFISFLLDFRFMNIITISLQFITGLAFLALGGAKLLGISKVRDNFARLRLPRWLRWTAGVLEVLGGAAMLTSIAQPFLAFFAAVLLAGILLAAVFTHIVRGPREGWPVAAGLLLVVTAIGGLQPLGLRVLALPKADVLPIEPVADATVLKTFPAGMWFESVKVAPDGTIFLSAIEGLDLQTGDKTKVHAQIIALSPDGMERVFHELPKGATAGALAFGPDGVMFMVGDGAACGVWRFTRDGKGELFAKLPEGSWPNGMDLGPDGKLYVSDSVLGLIWRIDPVSGAVEKAIEHDELRRRPFIALAPGANGLHFYGRDLFIAVSDAGKLLKLPLASDGKLGKPKVVATGVPGDDFAIDPQGVLYVTTHPYNTIVRITPDGTRTVIADAKDGVSGATDAAFGVRPGDTRTLYVATDGGAFAGNPQARGTLVALRLK